MKKIAFSVLVLLTVLLLTSCSGTAKSTTVVENSELGLKAWVEEGSYLYVEVKGNPTTGYAWGFSIDDDDVIEDVVSEYQMDKSEYEMVGVGGVYSFTFKAKDEGKARIVLSYARSWEVSAITTAVLDVTVDSDENIVSVTLSGVER